MADYRTTLFMRRVKKALKVLQEKGPLEFINRVRSFIQRRGQINFSSQSKISLMYDTSPVRFKGKKIDQNALNVALQSLKTKPFVLALSQDNYLSVVGGVQLKLADQQRELNEQGMAFLHLSPYLVRSTLDFSDQSGVMRLNLDGQFLGFVDDETLLAVLSNLAQDGSLQAVHIHHLMGWKLGYVSQLLAVTGDVSLNYWLHDFFSICPNYPLLRNDREYCHAPDPMSNACLLCIYGTIRPLHYQAFSYLFQRFPIQVVAPSEFALDLWRDKFPVNTSKGQVVPNAILEWGEQLTGSAKDEPLRVAFVGFPVLHKGWQTWLNLTNRFGKDPRYNFFHFSADWQPSTNFEKVSVEVTKQNRSAMTDALRENRVDIAFLWSICPETFSFTLFESLAAGCYVITNPASGNIQAYIKDHPDSGMIIDTEDTLLELFGSNDLIARVVKRNSEGRKVAKLVFKHGD